MLASLRDAPATIAELALLPSMRAQGQANVAQLALLLLHRGVLAIAAPQTDRAAALRLNRIIAERAGEGMPYDFLAAPAIASAIGVTREEMVRFGRFLGGSFDNAALPARWRALGVID